MTRTKFNTRSLVSAILALVLVAFAAPQVSAQESQVVIDGLNGPQGVLVDGDGMLWVTEVGIGGGETIEIFDTEAGGTVEANHGLSARVMRVDPATGGSVDVALLPSVRTPMGGFGGGRLLDDDGTLYVSVGEWATPETDRPTGIATIVRIDPDGSWEEVADTWDHERTHDPHPRGLHSNPYGLAMDADGRLLYADAGANALMAVDPATGAVETVTTFESLPGVFPRPEYDGEMLTDAVPTSVVVQGDRIFVSLLSGAPFVPGSAKVVEVAADGSVADHASGLTMLTDLRAAPDGNLYATTFAVFGEEGPVPGSGSVTRVRNDGSSETVVDGLDFVTSIDFDDDGNAYVATNGVGPPGSGQVIMVSGLAPASGGDIPVAGIIIALVVLAAGALLVMRFRSTSVVES